MLRISLLGAFRIERGMQSLHLPRRKVELLLVYLLLHPEPHSREKLAALFWGNFTDAQARKSLRTALPILRRELGDELLLIERETIQLNPAFPLWTDVREFEKQATEFLKDASLDPDAVNLALYRGELVTDCYEDWILPTRERYRALYLETLLRFIQHYRAQSEYERAIEYAQQALSVDPANERAHQHLMFCYVALGNRQAALEQYEKCVLALRDELAVEPASETVALYRWIKQTPGESSSPAARLTNLPIPLSSFIGRKKEIKEIKELISATRLLTLTGAGGSGKTRLAIQIATDLIDAFPDGAWWVDLAPLSDAALVPQQIAKAVGVRETTEQPLTETLANALREKQLLLALDNCEHLIDACAQLASDLLSHCSYLKILATSREALNIASEILYCVPTLSVPQSKDLSIPELSLQSEGVQLFVERVRGLKPNFTLTEQNALMVGQICQQLDGLPLAIELAAARTKLLTLEHIAARLNDRFTLLTDGNRAGLARQQTLRAMIDWSYGLLPPVAQKLFRRLSIFAGGFALNAAEGICTDESFEGVAVLGELSRLVDRSLVMVEQEVGKERYRMLETIRQYAYEKLRAVGENEEYHNRHLEFFLKLTEEAEPKLASAARKVWLNNLEEEHDNLHAALQWAQESDKPQKLLRLAGMLSWFWYQRGYFSEGQGWLTLGLTTAETEPGSGDDMADRARALFGIGLIVNMQADNAMAKNSLEESIRLWRALGARGKRGLAIALGILGGAIRAEGDPITARALSEEAIELFQEQKDQWGIAFALGQIGLAIRDQEDYKLSRTMIEEAMGIYQALGDKKGLADAIHYLGMVTYRQGEYSASSAFFGQALDIRRELGDKGGACYSLQNMALAILNQREDQRAKALFEESMAFARELGIKGNVATALHFLGYLAIFESEVARAKSFFQESLSLALQWGAKWICAMDVGGLGGVAAMRGQHERAAVLWGAAIARMQAVASFLDAVDRRFFDCTIASARDVLGEAKFEAALAEGHAMKFEQAVEYALEVE